MSCLPSLWIVIPCYNEESVLPLTAPLFLAQLDELVLDGKIDGSSQIVFINDGSSDNTWEIIKSLSLRDPRYQGISLSRNRGHQNALMAGLMEACGNCDICVSMDCDGQDDIRAIASMIDEYSKGNDVVYGVRSERKTDTAFKRLTAEGFYKMLRSMGADVVFNHADYRLMSARALDGLAQFGEANPFIRGLVPMVGFQSSTVEYGRTSRLAGESHYPLRKMLALAFDGITSLTIRPIRIISGIGALFALAGFVGVLWAIITAALGAAVSGWASTICLICMFGGLQLLALGVIGEYIGKIFIEVKGRPRYIVAERTWLNASDARGARSCGKDWE